MFNLNDILQSAQGGQAVNNLAQRFGISPEQAQAAVQALIPAISAGLTKAATNPGTLGSVISAVADGDHQASFSNPSATPSPDTVQKGSDTLTQILGSNHLIQQIAQRASAITGLRPELLMQILPVLVSLVLGGLATSLHNQGLSGMLGQLATAAQQGNLGSVTGSSGTTASAGGLMDMLSSLFGGLFGSSAGKPGDNPNLSAALDTLTKMFQTGTLPASVTQSGLQDSINKILSSGRP